MPRAEDAGFMLRIKRLLGLNRLSKHFWSLLDDQTIGKGNEPSRNEWIQSKLLDIPQGHRILDAGAGEQPYKQYCKHLIYTSQDFGKYDPSVPIGIQKKNFCYQDIDIVSDIVSIPREDCSFDVILCSEVLEHIIDPGMALRELARLLVPGGSLILTAPFCSLTHFAPFHFSTGFSQFFYQEHLNKLGFDIIELEPNGGYFDYLAQELHRLPGIAQRYASHSPDFWMRLAQKVLLRKIAAYSLKDESSSELLCYGFHVLAKKRL